MQVRDERQSATTMRDKNDSISLCDSKTIVSQEQIVPVSRRSKLNASVDFAALRHKLMSLTSQNENNLQS